MINEKDNNYKSQSIKDIIVAFAEAIDCIDCPLYEFCNRSEEGRRYGTCAGAAVGWLRAYGKNNGFGLD